MKKLIEARDRSVEALETLAESAISFSHPDKGYMAMAALLKSIAQAEETIAKIEAMRAEASGKKEDDDGDLMSTAEFLKGGG